MSESATIVLPLPPRVLSPNGQHGHWTRRAAALKKCRRLAKEATLAEGIQTGPWERAEMKATFYHAQKRRRDGANYNAMLKGYIDGIVDAQLAVDDDSDHWSTLPPDFKQDREFPRVEIVVRRVI